MNVLFVVPRSLNKKQMYKEYPIGVGILATILKKNGHDVLIYDGNVESGKYKELVSWIESFNPDVIGYSIITPNYPVAKCEIEKLKADFPNKLFIAGGLHATLFPEDLIYDGFDLVCMGEGENRIVDIIDNYSNAKGFSNIDGVVYSNDFGLIEKGKLIVSKVEVRNIPFVDRNVFNLSKYTHHSLMASRGCPYKCKFCCNYTGTVLQKGVSINGYERVLDELMYLQNEFNADEVFFADDIFLIKKSEILNFCKGYKDRGLKVKWIGQMRADTIDDEIAEAMSSSGCKRIYFGVESGSDSILKGIDKKIDKKSLLRGITSAKDAGIRVKTGWIYGLPGSLEEQYESIDFMLDMMPHEISIHQLIPFPGTPYYNNPDKYGIVIKNKKDFESFCYGGISGNIEFKYLNEDQLLDLYSETARRLESVGYVSSDISSPDSEYIYSTPINKKSMKVFKN